MWKLLIIAGILIHLGEAQRSSYAARPGSRSKVLPRFRSNETEQNLNTRGGEENGFSTTTLKSELQGTLEDHEFVHRVSQWPEDRQPFWFKNRKAISSMRDREIDGGNIISTSFNNNQRPRSPFQGGVQGLSGRAARVGSNAGTGRNDASRYDDHYYYYDNDPLLYYLHVLHNR